MNKAPTLTIENLRFDGREFQPHEMLTADRDFLQGKREISILVSGTDDVSDVLKIGCRLLKGNREIDRVVSCPASLKATTKMGTIGSPFLITDTLSPGDYQLQIWLEDEESAKSEPTVINIEVPVPLYIYILSLGLILIFAGLLVWKRELIGSHLNKLMRNQL
jgi:hypothetical protein